MSRAYTEEEIREQFLEMVRADINFWKNAKINANEFDNAFPNESDLERRLNGLAFSILVILDGESMIPGFKVIPDPHSDDKQYCIDNNEDWYPDDVDISGCLHEQLHAHK